MYLTGIAAYVFCRSACAVRRELQQLYYFSPCSHFEIMAICIGASIDPHIASGSFKFLLLR